MIKEQLVQRAAQIAGTKAAAVFAKRLATYHEATQPAKDEDPPCPDCWMDRGEQLAMASIKIDTLDEVQFGCMECGFEASFPARTMRYWAHLSTGSAHARPKPVDTSRNDSPLRRGLPTAYMLHGSSNNEGNSQVNRLSATRPADVFDSKPKLPRRAKKASDPDFIEPALATLRSNPPGGAQWLHEIKFDGYRLRARCALRE